MIILNSALCLSSPLQLMMWRYFEQQAWERKKEKKYFKKTAAAKSRHLQVTEQHTATHILVPPG